MTDPSTTAGRFASAQDVVARLRKEAFLADTIAGVKEERGAPVVDGRISFDIALAPESASELPAS